MCGIAGYVGIYDPSLINKMIDRLNHRGPDGKGFFHEQGVALGHSRLSIIDLTGGSQPITNEDDSLHLIFNGEIYNYQELRKELIATGHTFVSHSDSEIIIHSYEEYGKSCIEKFNGEFAFAIYDSSNRELFLARDRFGIRPLFYTHQDGSFIFASEIKALLLWNKLERTINPQGLSQYLLTRQVGGPHTLFEKIVQLPPAHTLSLKNNQITLSRYWDLPFAEEKNRTSLIEEFKALFEDSVRLRLQSDVPLGAFLSGGIDSSAVVAVMSKLISHKVKTFSIGFGTPEDELKKADKVAQFLGTEHESFTLSANAYQKLPKVVQHLDNLVGDAIILPIYLLAEKTAKKVKVVLTGEGADEILAGYVHQLTLAKTQSISPFVPLVANIVKKSSARFLNRFFPYPATLGNQGKEKLLQYMASWKNKGKAYLCLSSLFHLEKEADIFTTPVIMWLKNEEANMESQINTHLETMSGSFLNKILAYDIAHWLPDNILIKQDHLMMAHSLEGRVPFLDHRLVEFCAKLPLSLKIKGFTQKVLLKKAIKSLLPMETIQAKKQAFYIPTEKCFDAGFRDFIHDILLSRSFRERGIFSKRFLDSIPDRIKTNELIENKRIMALVILELWMNEFLVGVPK